ncbi:hypothetical protein EMIT0111MI5_10980 [Burkholderia sp. IT-111MI5]
MFARAPRLPNHGPPTPAAPDARRATVLCALLDFARDDESVQAAARQAVADLSPISRDARAVGARRHRGKGHRRAARPRPGHGHAAAQAAGSARLRRARAQRGRRTRRERARDAGRPGAEEPRALRARRPLLRDATNARVPDQAARRSPAVARRAVGRQRTLTNRAPAYRPGTAGFFFKISFAH